MNSGIWVLSVGDGDSAFDPARLELASESLTVVTESTATEALARLQSDTIHCLLAPSTLPETAPLTFIERIRGTWPTLPIVFRADADGTVGVDDVLAAGASDYIPSDPPIDQHTLLETRIANAVTPTDHPDESESKVDYREHERRFEAMFDDPNILVGLLDIDGTVIDINETAIELIDAGIEGVVGEPFSETPWFEGDETIQQEVREMIDRAAAGEYVEFELDLSSAVGEPLVVSGAFRPVTDDDGEVVSLLISDREITERRQRQQEALRNEHRFKALFTDPNFLIGLLEIDGTLLDGNQTALEYVDAELDEVVGMKFWETPWWSADMRPVIKEAVEQAASGEYVPYEADLTDREGDPYSVVGTIRPVQDSDGTVTSLVVSARDITERKQREQDLAESEARYQSLTEDVLDTSDVGTFVLGPEFDVVWVNQAIEEYFDIDREAVVGRDKPALIREQLKDIFEDSDGFARRVLGTYEDNRAVEEFECHVLAGTGRDERWLSHWSKPIESGLYEGGRIEHYTDITDRVKRDQQLDVMDRVLRHNLHNGMSIILGGAETIADQTDGEVAALAELIQESGNQLLAVTDKQRDIVKVVSEDPDVRTVDVGHQVRQAIARVRADHPGAEIVLTDIETVQAWAIPPVDKGVAELVENAVVHAASEAPRVEVSVSTTSEHVRICVADSNQVIPESERAILRGEGEKGPLYHGSGMGLWLVNWIVAASNGKITYGTDSPSGNRVTITLPVSMAGEEQLFGHSPGRTRFQASGRRER